VSAQPGVALVKQVYLGEVHDCVAAHSPSLVTLLSCTSPEVLSLYLFVPQVFPLTAFDIFAVRAALPEKN